MDPAARRGRIDHEHVYRASVESPLQPRRQQRTLFLPPIDHAVGFDGEVEFATLTLWESWDAVRAFAGDDAETAVVPEEARAVLSRWDERSSHYEIVERPADR